MTMLRGDALRMELHTMHRQARMDQPHHQAVAGLRVDRKLVRHARALDDERVIAGRLQRSVNAAKHPGTLVFDLGYLAVQRGCARHLAAKSLPDGLVAKAYTQNWDRRRSFRDKIEADAGFVWRARAG